MEVVEFELADTRQRARYDALFEDCPDAFIQQSTLWAEVVRELGPDRPFFLLLRHEGEDVAGLPLYLFENPLGSILTSVPQAGPLGGVFTRDDLPAGLRPVVYRELLAHAVELARRLECLALTVITNPFRDDLDLYERSLPPRFVLENYTLYIPLDRPVRLSGGQRNNLARARKHGFTVETCESAGSLARWQEVQSRRHQELGAPALDPRLFEKILNWLVPRDKAVFAVAQHAGQVASAGLYIRHRQVMDVFAISMDARYAASAPNSLVTEFSLGWGHGRGVRVYNWQSSPGRDSGVYRFKKMWGSLEVPYCFVTWLLRDAEAIGKLGVDTIRTQYPGHYLVPFGALQGGFDRVRHRKA